jgi:LPS export ABC transporter protein LptC
VTLKLRLIFALALIACCGFIACGEEDALPGASGPASPDSLVADQVTSDAHIFLYKAGRKTTDLIADEIRQYTRLDSTIALNLYVEFFDSLGERISTLTANHGYIREKDNFLAVTGDVEVVGKDSVILLTSYLEWDAAKDSVVTDSFVTIIREGDTTLTSYGMQSDPRLENITFKRASGTLTDLIEENDE